MAPTGGVRIASERISETGSQRTDTTANYLHNFTAQGAACQPVVMSWCFKQLGGANADPLSYPFFGGWGREKTSSFSVEAAASRV